MRIYGISWFDFLGFQRVAILLRNLPLVKTLEPKPGVGPFYSCWVDMDVASPWCRSCADNRTESVALALVVSGGLRSLCFSWAIPPPGRNTAFLMGRRSKHSRIVLLPRFSIFPDWRNLRAVRGKYPIRAGMSSP